MDRPTSSYIGRHAELYDFFYADKPYAEEAAFVDACLEKYLGSSSMRLLELACGTGTHSFFLEALGYDIIATDYSMDMLAQAKRKASENHSKIEFRQQDMRQLDVAERPFDAVICLFDAIGYVTTNENLRQVLHGVHSHLRPGGLFIFEFWHAAAMIRRYEPLRIRRWDVPAGEIIRISETSIDHAAQLGQVIYSIYELGNDGQFRSFQETQTNRFFLIQEMENQLMGADLKPLKWFAGFHEDEQIDDRTWHIVAVARRPTDGVR
jgi:SAM-dependent methyltransferase